jgi:hypothetical protein
MDRILGLRPFEASEPSVISLACLVDGCRRHTGDRGA